MQLVKSKNKQSEVSVIKKADFLKATGISADAIAPFEPLIFLNQKFQEIYQVKNCIIMLAEVHALGQKPNFQGLSTSQSR